MDAASVKGYRLLLSRIGLKEDDPGGEVRFIGSDPVIPSRLRYGAGTASALAAQAAAIASIWRMRWGRGQDITVDLRRAVALGLRTVQNLRQNGSYHVKTSLCQASMWVLGRGILKDTVEAPPLSSYVPGEGEILSMSSAFGDLKYVAPIAQFSETPASWATPPEPAGASAAQWR